MKHTYEKYIKFLIYLIAIFLLNIAGVTLFFRLDLTKNNLYSISEASREVVSTLSEPLTINVFFTKNLPAPHNNTERYIHDLLKEYANWGNDLFNYRFYDVTPKGGDVSSKTAINRKIAQNYGIFPVQIQAVEKDEIKFQKAYMGMVLIHGDMIEKIPAVTTIDGLEYRLTTAIQKLNNKVSALLHLPEKIQVNLYLSSSLKKVAPLMHLDRLFEYPTALQRIIKRLNDKNYGKLAFNYLDPTINQELEPELEKYKVLRLQWPAISNKKIPAGKGAVGIVMAYKDKSVTIQVVRVVKLLLMGTRYELTNINKMEEIINENLESLIDINEDLGVLADMGTVSISEKRPAASPGQSQRGENNLRSLLSETYSMKYIHLKDGTIPDSLNCLVLPGPTEVFTDYQLFQIDQFLMRGKSLAIFLDSFNEVIPKTNQNIRLRQQGPSYIPLHTGLEKFLAHYGIRINPSIVMDKHCFRQRLPRRLGGGEHPIYFAPIIKNTQINNRLNFMKNIRGLVSLRIAPLIIDEKRIEENNVTLHKLFSSSNDSWEMGEPVNLNPMMIQPPKQDEEMKSFDLAYLLEGKFSSYFAGKPIPEKAEPKKTDKKSDSEDNSASIISGEIESTSEFIEKGMPGKIFLIASSGMIKDNVLDTDFRNPNAMFILNTIDYLNGREKIATMRSKEQRFNPLNDTGSGVRTFIKTFTIAGLPVLIICFGLLVWLSRHTRKKRIKMMFLK